MPPLNCQSLLRLFQPWSASGFTVVPAACCPQFRLVHAPHSPLVAGFRKSQSATKLPRRGSPTGYVVSLQLRLVVVTSVTAGLLIV